MTEEDQLARDIADAVNEVDKARKPFLRPVPTESNAIAKATNENTERATVNMVDQMQKVIETIQRDIDEANEVRLTVIRRINDLHRALEASKTAMEMLKT